MGYPYGTQGAPTVGSGAPGLPQRLTVLNGDITGLPVQAVIIRTSTTYFTPDWATYARVTALGKGGQGLGGLGGAASGATGAHGGAGAGLAVTNIEQVAPGTPVNITFTSTATLAAFQNYQLSGGNGGNASSTAGGAAGVGSGGAVNFNGGAGETTTASSGGGGGGGAAGRNGPGQVGGFSIGGTGGAGGAADAYATSGGAGGAGRSNGGLGTGGLSRMDACVLGAVTIGKSCQNYIAGGAASINYCDGGDGGGGSGGSINTTDSNVPGAGLVLIELW